MARSKDISAESLAALGAEALAEALVAHAATDAALREKLGMMLAAAKGAGSLAGEIAERLKTIARSRSFVEWDKRKALSQEPDHPRTTTATRPAKPTEAAPLPEGPQDWAAKARRRRYAFRLVLLADLEISPDAFIAAIRVGDLEATHAIDVAERLLNAGRPPRRLTGSTSRSVFPRPTTSSRPICASTPSKRSAAKGRPCPRASRAKSRTLFPGCAPHGGIRRSGSCRRRRGARPP
jgi:hypothetical protein